MLIFGMLLGGLLAFQRADRNALHAPWDALLRRHVSAEGRVNYKGFATERAELNAYLNALAQSPPAAGWSRADKMAYWINAYNAFTVALIVEHYPLKSITQLDGGKTWDVKRIEIGGKKYSLNDIENGILRPQFGDARIHFAINCAARSCPPLHNRAYTADNLERTLEERTRKFIRNERFNRIGPARAEVSKIFDWYADDFGDLRAFLSRYAGVTVAPTAAVVFMEYDWGLNE
ncbi:MAG: DUF547 domain-containing protein [Saprospiraceae bacterium]|nr:DUF547 domain-containing protein [Saprospiraceae bacterium]MDW8228655.1 DUF547 domain-containing protein [Saprospiraceae bacterium]